MEIAALKLAASVVSPLITKLSGIAASYFGGDITDEDFRNLESVLTKIQAVLAAADDCVAANYLSPWLKDLKAAAYEVEDVIDMCEYKCIEDEVSSLPTPLKKTKGKAKSFFAPLFLKTKLKKCVEKLQPFAIEAEKWKDLLIRRDVLSVPLVPSTVSSPSSPIFGRDGERDLLISKLMLPSNNHEDKKYSSGSYWRIPIVAIYGLGGAGKTTLAQYIFNDHRIVEYFPMRLWVHVSRNLDVFVVTKRIIESATKGECPRMENLDTLQAHLKEHLKSNGKLLLVLDDVWLDETQNRESFDQLMIPFNEVGDRGSKVLVTTRTERTAVLMGVSVKNIVPLEELNFLDCWSIVKHYAFGDVGRVIDDSELAQVGDSIIHKMKKSPLAAQMVGVQLRAKVDINAWRNILQGDILKSTKDVLLWSYKHLPAHLQQCFAFCSLFPKGWKFNDLEELVRLWIANGFVVPDSKCESTLEDLGRQYFDDLLSFTFFKPHPNSSNSYVIHDLLHDLAEDVSKDHCYRIEGSKLAPIPKTIIHLSIHTEELITHMPAIINLMNLRTLIFTFPFYSNFINDSIIKKIFENLSKLRVLCFGWVELNELHHSIGKLKHLQYLQVHLKNKLPKTLGRAYHLKFLDLRRSLIKGLPKRLNDLMNLRCLLVNENIAPNLMPEVGKLTSLNTLNVYHVSKKKGHEIGQLKNLELRGALEIGGLENVKDKAEAVGARLRNKKHLGELSLKWTADSSEVDDERYNEVLEGLEPPPNIKHLSIFRYNGVVSPSWLLSNQRGLSKLQRVRLFKCSNWKELPSLPSLVSLEIERAKAVEEVGLDFFYRTSGGNRTAFPNLKYLTFYYMENLMRWSVPRGVGGVQLFPCLSELIIMYCPMLKEIPSLPPTLCDLLIWDCPSLMMELSPFPPLLKRLRIYNCPGTKTLISEMMSSSSSSSLESLKLKNCSAPDVMVLTCPSSLTSVTKIKIENCVSLISLDMSINKSTPDVMTCPSSLTSVTKITVENCESLTSLVLGDHMKALLRLRIVGCKNLRSVEGIGSLPSLKELHIWFCPMLVMSMEPVVYHVCCQKVTILGCPNLAIGSRSVAEVVHRRSSITSLHIDDPSLFEEMSEDLTSLSDLTISNCKNLSSLPVNLLNNLSSLEELNIRDCPELESLPELENLSSLKELEIERCPKLESLPNLTNLSSLEELTIWNSNLIAVNYRRGPRGGPRHHEVVHIPKLDIS